MRHKIGEREREREKGRTIGWIEEVVVVLLVVVLVKVLA